ncbi:MAG TPA: hypothetical protein VMU32_12610, partial [Solirubrobacteraceae bacterium]|nr:hypothetical protein [Solirubrobacteraceae bacterium]
QAMFPIVLFGSIALFVVIGGIASVLSRRNLYDQIGQGGLSTDGLGGAGGHAPLGGAIASAEREQEIRQMLQARSDRLVRQGQPALDIDAEVARLHLPEAGGGYRDASLAEEVRQLVVARNERRRRQGQPELDVDAEVARTLAELDA